METLYNTKFIQSGERLEVYKYRAYLKQGGESRNKEGRKGRQTVSEEDKKNNTINSRRQNLNNAKNKINRLVKCNPDLNTFITLTYKENMQDLVKSKQHLSRFFKKIKSEFSDLKYIYVLQFQRRGAIHFHVLCNFPIPIKTSKRVTKEQNDYNLYFMRKFWKHGYCDCRNLYCENINAGRYISAYITKDLFEKDMKGYRCYTTSRNINKPIVTKVDMKATNDQMINTEGYKLKFYNKYKIAYSDKNGKARENTVYYYDFIPEDWTS